MCSPLRRPGMLQQPSCKAYVAQKELGSGSVDSVLQAMVTRPINDRVLSSLTRLLKYLHEHAIALTKLEESNASVAEKPSLSFQELVEKLTGHSDLDTNDLDLDTNELIKYMSQKHLVEELGMNESVAGLLPSVLPFLNRVLECNTSSLHMCKGEEECGHCSKNIDQWTEADFKH